MPGLHMLSLLIIIIMIYAVGHWHYRECQRRRIWEDEAVQDRWEIREVAEVAASEAASCAAVIDKIGTTEPQPNRRLWAVRDN